MYSVLFVLNFEKSMVFLQVLAVFLVGIVSVISIGKANNTKKVVVLLCGFFITVATAIDLYEEDEEKNRTIERLSRIGSHIFWDETKISYRAIDSPNDIKNLALGINLKVISRLNSKFPKSIDLASIIERSQKVHAFDYKQLTVEDSLILYTAHANKDGRVVVKDEINSKIHTFIYSTSSIEKDLTFDSQNILTLEYGANARTMYRSLYDLNDSFIIFDVGSLDSKKLNSGFIQVNIKSDLGMDILSVGITNDMLHQVEGRRFLAGIYIPENYWKLDQ